MVRAELCASIEGSIKGHVYYLEQIASSGRTDTSTKVTMAKIQRVAGILNGGKVRNDASRTPKPVLAAYRPSGPHSSEAIIGRLFN